MGQRSPAVRCSRKRRLFREYGAATACGSMCRHARLGTGFALIEPMASVTRIGIVAAAYPSYIQHVARPNRAAAGPFLLEASSVQERFQVDDRADATSLAAQGYGRLPANVSPAGYVLAATLTNATGKPPHLHAQAARIAVHPALTGPCVARSPS